MNIFKIILFSIMLNFATGLILLAIPAFNTVPEYSGGLSSYNENYSVTFVNTLGGDVSSGDSTESSSDRSLFDSIGLKYGKILSNTFDNYIFGFVTVLESIFGSMLGQSLSNIIFGALRTIIIILNILFIISFFTGKDIKRVGD